MNSCSKRVVLGETETAEGRPAVVPTMARAEEEVIEVDGTFVHRR